MIKQLAKDQYIDACQKCQDTAPNLLKIYKLIDEKSKLGQAWGHYEDEKNILIKDKIAAVLRSKGYSVDIRNDGILVNWE